MTTKKQKKSKSKLNKTNNSEILDINIVDRKGVKRENSDSKEQNEPVSKVLKTVEDPPGENATNSGKPKLTGEEYLALKQRLKERKKFLTQLPILRLREFGVNASLNIPLNDRIPLFMSDIQHLILLSQLELRSPYTTSRWCSIEKLNRLRSMNVLILDNISMEHFTTHENEFRFLNERFPFKLEVVTPSAYSSDIIKDLSMVALTRTQVRTFTHKYGSLENAIEKSGEIFDTFKHSFPIEKENNQLANNISRLPKTDKFPRTQLLLSGWQMVEENFPLPIKGLFERKYVGYKLTKDKYKPVTASSPMFAIDCEMCRTTIGDGELTRISIIDEKHNVIYDTLVKPPNKIVDYLTRFSGITPKMMRNVTKRLEDVQLDIERLLPDDAILVGQSLNNDLHALKIMHPYIIDTSIIFNITGDRSRKTKLAVLSNQFLQEKIQESSSGHCSSEDSLACMKLVQLKLQNSLYFGDAVMGGVFNECSSHPDLASSQYATSLFKQVTKFGNKARIVANSSVSSKYKHYIDKNVKDNKPETKNVEFAIGKCSDDIVNLGCKQLRNPLNLIHLDIDDDLLNKNHIKTTVKHIDDWIKKFYENVSFNGLLCVIFGGKHNVGNGVCFLEMKKNVKIN